MICTCIVIYLSINTFYHCFLFLELSSVLPAAADDQGEDGEGQMSKKGKRDHKKEMKRRKEKKGWRNDRKEAHKGSTIFYLFN